jgi:hypothetical protein
MSVFFAKGSEDHELSSTDLREGLFEALQELGHRRRVLAVAPDFTRYHSFAGELTKYTWQYYGEKLSAVLPALGTHAPMTSDEIQTIFGDLPLELFHTPDWRKATVKLGEVPTDTCTGTV